jgi:hypothetical protein
MEKELHILVGCADARDLSQVQMDVMREKTVEYRTRGIEVELQVIRAAGSFISSAVYDDIRHIILGFMKEKVAPEDHVDYYVHIQTHGHLTADSQKDYVGHIHQMKVVDGSAMNCGMLHASALGIELEQLLLEEQPEVRIADGTLKVKEDNDIRTLLREVYAYDGYLAGDWLKSIDFLRTHPRAQKAKLESLIAHEADLRRLNIRITAGIMDYSIHSLIRLDGGVPVSPWWDDVQRSVRERAALELDTLRALSEKQKPLAGLFCMSDPRATSRTLAARFYLRYKGLEAGGDYLPNTIFNISGSTFDIPDTPFGPYMIGGFFYAVKHLGLLDQMVMGGTAAQTARIMQKLHRDPLMDLIIRRYRVNLIPINQEDLR